MTLVYKGRVWYQTWKKSSRKAAKDGKKKAVYFTRIHTAE